MSKRKTKSELIAEGLLAQSILREAVEWVDGKRRHPSFATFSPEWYESAKKFFLRP